jgi:predicted SprT family Zn-dependent metalloprotease
MNHNAGSPMIDMTSAPLTKSEIEQFAKQKLAQFGLNRDGWTFGWNNRKRALGLCNYTKKKIFVSESCAKVVAGDKIKDTVLHEIAHALAGAGTGHGIIWKQWCVKVGAVPQSQAFLPETQTPKGKYKLMFNDEVIEHLHRRPKWANDLSNLYIKGRKSETKGKLKLVVSE